MKLQDALHAAPVAPACFSDAKQWAEYLLSAQHFSKGASRPFINGEFQASWNFCNDCTLEHTTRMSRQGKCNPSIFRAAAPKKVLCEQL